MELYLPGLVKITAKFQLRLRVAYKVLEVKKSTYPEKKQLVKQTSTLKINFNPQNFTF